MCPRLRPHWFFAWTNLLKKIGDDVGNLPSEQRRHGISNLSVLFRSWPLEKIIVGKSLQARSLPNGQASALARVVMNEVMAVLGNVGSNGRGRTAFDLNPEAIVEFRTFQRF